MQPVIIHPFWTGLLQLSVLSVTLFVFVIFVFLLCQSTGYCSYFPKEFDWMVRLVVDALLVLTGLAAAILPLSQFHLNPRVFSEVLANILWVLFFGISWGALFFFSLAGFLQLRWVQRRVNLVWDKQLGGTAWTSNR